MFDPKTHSETIKHGDDYKGELLANFSSNVWFGAQHEGLYAHLSQCLPQICRYPEEHNNQLKTELAVSLNTQPNELLLTNGSVEGIYLLAQTFRGSESLIIQPTFSEYAHACRANKHKISYCNAHELSENIENSNPGLVWLCNPNNPDGYCFDPAYLEMLFHKHPDTLFILDVSFREFALTKQPDFGWINHFPNVVFIYSFTKRYGIPGLRLGYIHSNALIIDKVSEFSIPWSVNTLAAESLKYIVSRYHDEFNIEKWLSQKDNFCMKINEIDGFECIPGETPFFLVKLHKGNSTELKHYLLERGILIRGANNFFHNGEQYIRLLTLTDDKNALLIQELSKWKQHLSA